MRKLLLVSSISLVIVSSLAFLNGGEAFVFEGQVSKSLLIKGSDYPDKVLKLIEASKKRVWVCMYVMRYSKKRAWSVENTLVESLVDRYRSGVDVRVVIDAGMIFDQKKKKMGDVESSKNQSAYKFLKSKGVPVRYDSLDQTMHGKTLVVDNEYTLIGSANWTYSALKKNVEYSILTKSAEINTQLAESFLKLWKASENKKLWTP